LQEGRESLCIEVELIGDFTQGFEDLGPVEMGKELSESADKVIDAPGHRVLLVHDFFLQNRAICLAIGLEGELGNLRSLIIRARVVDGKIEEGPCHGLLVDVLEVLEDLQQLIVVVRGHVAELDQKLPGLKHFVALVKIIDAIPLLEEGNRWVVGVHVCEHKVLLHRSSERHM
jgi:hypothetical protein